jgi:hypothetical protein
MNSDYLAIALTGALVLLASFLGHILYLIAASLN